MKQIVHVVDPASSVGLEELNDFLSEGYIVVQATPILSAHYCGCNSAASSTSRVIYILQCPEKKIEA